MSATVRMYPVLKASAALDCSFAAEVPELYYHGDDGRCMMELRDNEGSGLYYNAVISDESGNIDVLPNPVKLCALGQFIPKKEIKEIKTDGNESN